MKYGIKLLSSKPLLTYVEFVCIRKRHSFLQAKTASPVGVRRAAAGFEPLSPRCLQRGEASRTTCGSCRSPNRNVSFIKNYFVLDETEQYI